MAEREYERIAADGADGAETAPPAMDAEGTITAEFVDAVAEAVESGEATRVRELAGDLHEADLAALVEALHPDARPRLVELMGADFDFVALTEVDVNIRDEILEELPASTVAEGNNAPKRHTNTKAAIRRMQ